ncbi:PHP domain-containing protein [Alkalilimnicola ehrlichii MLHE-1]|uniref:PHP C-terminal domain protein n=1 Tax=Alkalilimnicola ehrlichii (strain ATCC BAA-1101 / DSM 17681 / MLHE-1) TaxID=187272 RepID=Q0AAU6_ALKEH|nr:PHP domain-containing protein [Alkalilimnicola ehrlichii]ABI56041.1 PHP C-terminal domain protein [Alkalilimnicola ehrlichii MLHE-1]
MSACIDLHSHSTASDGRLTPTELVTRARAKGVATLALTDHDTTAGVAEAQAAAEEQGLRLIPGVEISTTWARRDFHIVGLGVAAQHPGLQTLLAEIDAIRRERALTIGRKLARHGMPGAWEGASARAGAATITRSHYAGWLVAEGHVNTPNEAFHKWLRKGRPAGVSVRWPGMERAVACIREAGGVAVLAHPLAYGLTGAWMRRVLTAFRDAGGEAMEVACGTRPRPVDVARLAEWARRYALLASQGSDFHHPDNPWVDLGRLPRLPADLTPVWHHPRLCNAAS